MEPMSLVEDVTSLRVGSRDPAKKKEWMDIIKLNLYYFVAMNEYVRNGLKFVLCYEQMFKFFIISSISLLTSHRRDHTLNLRRKFLFISLYFSQISSL